MVGRHALSVVRMDVKRTEVPCKTLVVLGRDVLVAEHKDVMIERRLAYFGQLVFAERLGKIDSSDVRADHRVKRCNRNDAVSERLLVDIQAGPGTCGHWVPPMAGGRI